MNRDTAVAFYLLYEADEPLTTSEVAQMVFQPDGGEELRNAERKVRYYFEDGYESLVERGERDDGTAVYEANDDRLWSGPGAMHVGDEGELVEIDFGMVLVYMGDDAPHTVQLEHMDGLPSMQSPDSEETDF